MGTRLEVEGTGAGPSSLLESIYSTDFTRLLLDRADAGAGADFLIVFLPATFEGAVSESSADCAAAGACLFGGGSSADAGAGRFLEAPAGAGSRSF